MAPPMEFILTIYREKMDRDDIEEGQKIRWENPQKFMHKLNKQQTERWRHLANLSKLFLPKSFHADNVTEGRKFSGKMHQNSCINCISSKQNYEKISV